MQWVADLVKPVFPEVFASGTIINGFTPDNNNKQQTDSLINAIQAFRCGVVLVLDNEKLERDIINRLSQRGKQNEVTVVKVPKSQGIPSLSSSWQSAEEQETTLFNEYQDYFRGKHYQAFARNENERAQLGLEGLAVRNELDPQPIYLPIEKIKIFEVIGHNIHRQALPRSATAPEEVTSAEEIEPKVLQRDFNNYKHRILAAVQPKEIAHFKQLEARIAQNPSNDQLKEDFKELLLKSCTLELLQIRAFKAEKYLEVVRTCANKQNEAVGSSVGGAGAAAEIGDAQANQGE